MCVECSVCLLLLQFNWFILLPMMHMQQHDHDWYTMVALPASALHGVTMGIDGTRCYHSRTRACFSGAMHNCLCDAA